ncbi:hypothetical protein C8J56DRAFT_278895 [Mycena floridula]|nr:hypothetical protein C8J56DRAFT_278895 [Mycena floridula]
MGNCMSNQGDFEPPGSKAMREFTSAYDEQTDPVKVALKAAEKRAQALERRLTLDGAPAPVTNPKPKGPKCSVCFKYCQISAGGSPWMLTKNALLVAEMSDSDDEDEDITEVHLDGRPKHTPPKIVIHGIQLKCTHYFCGACLSQAIFRSLNISFDPTKYGTNLTPFTPVFAGRRAEFPISCPTCQFKPGEKAVEISDNTARLVLGEPNMEPWDDARYLSTLNLIYCPHKGCNELLNADDIAPAPKGVQYSKNLVQCPRCKGSLCISCKVVWHQNLTCAAYQALPLTERAPEDVAFANLARLEKWRRCPKCSAMVELKSGCNHITCTCKHHFCYTCGSDFEHKGGKYRCKGGSGCKVWEEQNLLERN